MSGNWYDGLRGTRYLFFTGKGGVGKTSLACATSVMLAESGKSTLLVSTDPASNLDEVLGVQLTGEPTQVPHVQGLFALNINPEESARRYRERAVGPYRGVLPDVAVRNMEEQLSGACTTEIAAFDEFTTLLGGSDLTASFDRIVFDTAPTGHTLRLLSLPAAWTRFMETNTSGVSCLGPLAALQKQESLYKSSVDALRNATATTVVLVARPDLPSLNEAARACSELAELGVANQRLIVNGVFSATDRTDPVAVAIEARGRAAILSLPLSLSHLERTSVPLLPRTVVGLESVRMLLDLNTPFSLAVPHRALSHAGVPLESIVNDLARAGHGVIMTMGKGGVGKTTLAAAIATELARRGYKTLLTTTDPAAHVAAAAVERPVGLTVERIDPADEVEKYTKEVLLGAKAIMDEEGLSLLEEDLRSPCTEEIAVFRAFAEAVAKGTEQFVVLDTAPTGHTILLLDAAEAYHRDVLRTTSEMPESVRTLLPRLRDPEFTKILIVTLPEPTPVHEALALQSDLQRAEIQAYAWVLNQSLLAANVTDPVLATKAAQEIALIEEVAGLSPRFTVVPWAERPAGVAMAAEAVS